MDKLLAEFLAGIPVLLFGFAAISISSIKK